MYTQTDFDQNRARVRRNSAMAVLAAVPFIALLIAGFALRIEPMAAIGCLLACSVMILLWDLRIAPVWRYGRYLKEIHSGLNHKTLGTLVRIGGEPFLKDGVSFRDMIINIYEDQSEEGERRFLLDGKKEIPADWMGRDIVLTSHGNMVLDVELAKESAPCA